MFHYLHKHTIPQIILSVLLLAGAFYMIFARITLFPPQGQGLLYYSIYNLLVAHPIALKITAAIILLLQILLILRFFHLNRFSENPTNTPLLFTLLVLVAGHFPELFSPATISNLILTFILLFNTRDTNEQPVKNRVLSSGMLIGITSLIDPYSIWALLFLVLALLTNRFSKFKEIIILFVGFLLVYLYVFSVGYLTNSTAHIMDTIRQTSFFTIFKNLNALKVLDYVLAGMLLVGMIYIMSALKLYFDNKLIILRKRYLTILLLFIVMVITMAFSGYTFRQGLVYLVVPISLMFSMVALLKKRKILNDLVILAILVLLWL